MAGPLNADQHILAPRVGRIGFAVGIRADTGLRVAPYGHDCRGPVRLYLPKAVGIWSIVVFAPASPVNSIERSVVGRAHCYLAKEMRRQAKFEFGEEGRGIDGID
ncbi:hypothetical protein [Rhizobium leguminosarum]|uniref:hypothetical protein n=1 Tax=Rhizobium leguminosarum TaxID=384 RepID=UPI000565CC22|nr:hypothetical protein [Rhizobium leguminosarum]